MKSSFDATQLVKIGKIIEPRALKGELKIFLLSGEASWQNKVQTLYLKSPEGFIPFEVEYLKEISGAFVVKLKNLNDRTQAEKYLDQEIFLPATEFHSVEGENVYLRELLNFKVFNGPEEVGPVTGFETNTQQDILVVNAQKNSRF